MAFRARFEAVKVNVFHTMEFLLKYSEALREKVKTGELEIHGAVPRELIGAKITYLDKLSTSRSVYFYLVYDIYIYMQHDRYMPHIRDVI